ncbi:asparagine synthase [Alkaliphilus serpentinus]|uniref:Asparagine synthase n=1 Tax=Alkaliphilus serpentinus TaxID=1482731 RepID=A0A833M7U4_9FIRM|nr:asparagine synthase [Alkaliphilus serpentinus]
MREGMVPTILGTGVTAAGVALKGMSMKQDRSNMMPMVAAGIIGFGLAHVVLGTIDLIEHNKM